MTDTREKKEVLLMPDRRRYDDDGKMNKVLDSRITFYMSLIAALAVIFAAYYSLQQSIAVMNVKLDQIAQDIKKQNETIATNLDKFDKVKERVVELSVMHQLDGINQFR